MASSSSTQNVKFSADVNIKNVGRDAIVVQGDKNFDSRNTATNTATTDVGVSASLKLMNLAYLDE